MSDEKLRRLEREWQMSGLDEDKIRYKTEAIRMGMGEYREYMGQIVNILINSNARFPASETANNDTLITARIVGETTEFLKLEDIVARYMPLKTRSTYDTSKYKKAQIKHKYIIGVFQEE